MYIKKNDLIVGQYYKCDARNFDVGKWNGKEFEYMRYKWGEVFPAVEYHYDDGAPYGTVKPFKIAEIDNCG